MDPVDTMSGNEPASPFAIAVGQRLKAARTERGQSQEEVARHAGVSRPAYGMWEAGKVLPDVARLAVLADYLRVRPEYLAFGVGADRDADSAWIEEVAPSAGNRLQPQAKWALPSGLIKNLVSDNLKIVESPRNIREIGVARGDKLMLDISHHDVDSPGYYAFWNGSAIEVGFASRIMAENETLSRKIMLGGTTHSIASGDVRIAGKVMLAFVDVT